MLLQKHAPIKKPSNKDKKQLKSHGLLKGYQNPLKKRTEFTENVLELKMLQKRGTAQLFQVQ